MSLSSWSGVYTSIGVVGGGRTSSMSLSAWSGWWASSIPNIGVVGRRIALCLSLNRPNVFGKRLLSVAKEGRVAATCTSPGHSLGRGSEEEEDNHCCVCCYNNNNMIIILLCIMMIFFFHYYHYYYIIIII